MEVNERGFSNKALEDFDLIDKAVDEKDQQAYATLMKRYKKAVYFMILKMIRDADDAEDLTMEAFAKAFKNLHRFKKDYTFSTWLFRIATNNTIDFIRKKKLKTMSLNTTMSDDSGNAVNIDVEDDDNNPQDEFIKSQRIEMVRIFVDKLPAKYRKLVQLRYFDELSYEEIAQELEKPLGTVKAQLHRSRELLYEIASGKEKHI
ncbi:MAG TPA: RNA polymerase subunit sigma-24 [Algoriphagus sp.]|jgi:RNA polymerase sigma factor (sigma-70 family)|uniref:RNA polymerase, sigma subunit, SigW n=1 Tax=Algoriphagus ornithinivorans TaxID=226506 RepID=A0A1I5IC81_9BACT|nr:MULTISPECIES: sigma-70 family RNA polymerase sigma factor [Algoriphagus]MAL14308.1 RNA polymerase subunit sigma-24 [Algoriphagus sp.]MAN88030.1 RNA polymerase subunit sigma-24 [Algoriphagus sp.]QYH37364.1 sigma-70 family RNA polymerase sigma factor [Algoriphagus sp. NBT04N3]SFO57880.1 RNA polymerase, sigma subunit, SigW [Algoriphagus ornithinivorans]HAD52742.1 RNA polymerase subunit sigma-24 [Algoriphagus sp.]|tara:strand:- start:421 stop:1032 length:612 start_codon:yes stop_codon:yes gene_type:complete